MYVRKLKYITVNHTKMKYIITLLAALIISVASYADVVRNGDTFKVEKTISAEQAKELGVYYQDKDGIRYLIYQSKNGSLYIKRISKKTNKEYKQYLPKDVQEAIKKELNIQ